MSCCRGTRAVILLTRARYGAVVRGTNAYVPPGARKGGPLSPGANPAKGDVPKVSVNGPDGAAASQTQTPPPSSSKGSSPAPSGSAKVHYLHLVHTVHF